MKHIDDQIREVFSQKLSAHEADVPAHLWDAVQANIGGGSTAGVASGVKILSTKLIAMVSAALVAVAALVYFAAKEIQEPSAIHTPPSSVHSRQQTETNPSVVDQQDMMIETPLEQPQHKEGLSESVTSKGTDQFIVVEAYVAGYEEESKRESEGPENVQSTIPFVQQTTPSEEDANDAGSAALSEKNKLTGVFKILPSDLNEMRYSFQTEDKAVSYRWDFGDDNASELASPGHQYANEGNYTVTLTVMDDQGRQKSSTHELNVYKPGKVTIPNIFTPNGDGSNDHFDPYSGSEGVAFNHIIITDNQGKKVFESDGSIPWDGTDMSGNPCNGGSYQYYVSGADRNQEILENKGIVVLIR